MIKVPNSNHSRHFSVMSEVARDMLSHSVLHFQSGASFEVWLLEDCTNREHRNGCPGTLLLGIFKPLHWVMLLMHSCTFIEYQCIRCLVTERICHCCWGCEASTQRWCPKIDSVPLNPHHPFSLLFPPYQSSQSCDTEMNLGEMVHMKAHSDCNPSAM